MDNKQSDDINLQNHGDLVNVVQYYLEQEGLFGVIDDEILGNGDGGFEVERSPKLLDLEKLAFDQIRLSDRNGGMEELAGGRKVVQLERGYHEVHIPPLNTIMATGGPLVKVSEMPVWAQPAFEGMNQLDRLQSRVYSTALHEQENMLICAPIGSEVRDIAVLTMLMKIRFKPWKIITYLVHTEVCVAEVVTSLSNRLRSYNVEVQTDSDAFVFEKHRIIVTTPDKWEIACRNLGQHGYIQAGKLLIIEKIHLLQQFRGHLLESIVARTIRAVETRKDRIRLVGFCAPVPNYEDVAAFLRVSKEKGLFCFDDSFRPCPLAQQYVRITDTKPLGRFHLMNDLCYEKVKATAGKRQILIYVHSREETIRTACEIRRNAHADGSLSLFLTEHSSSGTLHGYAALVNDIYLKELLPYGYAIYHSGMATGDCNIVKRLFGDGHVQVLVSTVEFAWHVNLPAHTVIVKGTDVFDQENGIWCELSPPDVMQMLGCARKALPNSSAEAIVLTDVTKRKYYLALMNGNFPIESQFIFNLPLHLFAEILIGSVRNVRDACHWISYTYLYIRMLKNPTLYGLMPEDVAKDVGLKERKADLVHAAATILEKREWVKYDKESGSFEVTLKGRYAGAGG
ncbi:RNA helicase [Ranunculus cassubicifolius]